MVVLACNFLHMIRQFYVWGEKVKRSMDWLIKRLIKVGARFLTMPGSGMSTWSRLFPWPSITGRCLPGILKLPSLIASGIEGLVCPKSGKKLLYAQICATMLSIRGVGLRNGNFGGFSSKQRGPQNQFLDRGSKSCHIISDYTPAGTKLPSASARNGLRQLPKGVAA